MRTPFFNCAAGLIALGLAIEPAEARGRKPATPPDDEPRSGMIAERNVRSVAGRADALAASSKEVTSSVGRSPDRRNADAVGPLAEQQTARPNPLSFKLGAVTLQPAVGGIKGAQFSIGF